MTRFLVTTGPESSGKTTLATQLAASLQAPLIEEASRDYLTALHQRQPGTTYGEADLLAIAQLQHQREQVALQQHRSTIVCDTDLLVIIVWSEVKYGHVDRWMVNTFEQSLLRQPRLYFVCDPEIPWQYDPLREHPAERAMLFDRYRDKLMQYGCDYLHVRGDEKTRLQLSLNRFSSPP